MDSEQSASIRACFTASATAFAELVAKVPPDAWDRPALGVWNVRDLVGHTSRALSTIEAYLGKASAAEQLTGPVDYFLAARATLADPEAVARRGREAGEALGEDPASNVAALAQRVVALVGATDDDAPVASPVGAMTLAGYLPTRTFELTVHGLDISRAVAVDAPAGLGPSIAACCELAGRLAARSPRPTELLLAMTGRTAGFADGLTVL